MKHRQIKDLSPIHRSKKKSLQVRLKIIHLNDCTTMRDERSRAWVLLSNN